MRLEVLRAIRSTVSAGKRASGVRPKMNSKRPRSRRKMSRNSS
jgi:hypothetical protein